MPLSSDLISQIVKSTKQEKKKTNESTTYGTVVEYEGRTYVKFDGSELLTPITTTSSIKDGDRVTVMIKDHAATVTGNTSDPSASGSSVIEQGSKITEFEHIVAHKVTTDELQAINAAIETLRANLIKVDKLDAVKAEIDELEARLAKVDHLTATDIEAINAQIEHLEVVFGSFTDISAEDLTAINAEINKLKAYTAEFTYVSAEVLEAVKASIGKLQVDKLDANTADLKYANIDFTNIGKAAIEYFYAKSGLIKDIVVGDGTITGELVGVTIKGDLIEGNTVKADKLVVKGDDGIYYKLNFEAGTFTDGEPVPDDSLHGSIITAKSITAEKVSVKDLVAFDATIAGFHITDTSIYSGVKETVDNNTRGIYMDKSGQLALGDTHSFIKYYRDEDETSDTYGQYKLEISASSIYLNASDNDIAAEIEDLKAMKFGATNLIRNSTNMIFGDYYFGKWSLTATDDGVGNVAIDSPMITVTDDGAGNVVLTVHPRIICESDDHGGISMIDKENSHVAFLDKAILDRSILA